MLREEIPLIFYASPSFKSDYVVHNSNLYVVQKGNLAVTRDEMQIFLGINIVIGYVMYARARIY